MDKTNEPKPKKNDPVIHVSLHEDELKALLSILNLFKEEDITEPRKDGKQAEKIMDVIFKYRKAYKRSDGTHYTICFFESQAAAMMKFFAKTVRMIKPLNDNSNET